MTPTLDQSCGIHSAAPIHLLQQTGYMMVGNVATNKAIPPQKHQHLNMAHYSLQHQHRCCSVLATGVHTLQSLLLRGLSCGTVVKLRTRPLGQCWSVLCMQQSISQPIKSADHSLSWSPLSSTLASHIPITHSNCTFQSHTPIVHSNHTFQSHIPITQPNQISPIKPAQHWFTHSLAVTLTLPSADITQTAHIPRPSHTC